MSSHINYISQILFLLIYSLPPNLSKKKRILLVFSYYCTFNSFVNSRFLLYVFKCFIILLIRVNVSVTN